ncbi:MAG: LptF/LptG family permease [Desulfobulbaceae bacterium]|nr:LptF/LptG family permease [Candidatus Kapabacteria bacterium]MBS4000931.1 LptF/LptG family permease [Desulfobulbaceae bacterium]
MTLIDRYILRTHIAPLLFGFSTVMFIYLMQFIMNYLSKLVGKGLSEWVILHLIVLNLAWMVILALPMGVLFSSLMAFGSMAANQEITIVKASGGSVFRMMAPVLIGGLLLSYALFWFNDEILPDSNLKAKLLMSDITRKKPTFSIESGRFSTQLDGYTILARQVDSASGNLHGVTIYDVRRFQERNIISSDSGTIKFDDSYSNLIVTLFDGEIHRMNIGLVRDYRIVNFGTYEIGIPAYGFAFERSQLEMGSRGDREMRISDMQQIVDSARTNRTNIISRIDSVLNGGLALVSGSKKKSPIEKTEKIFVDESQGVKRVTGAIQHTAEVIPDSIMIDTNRIGVITRVIQNANITYSSIQADINQAEFFLNKSLQYEVEIHKKYAIPFACFIFVLVGAPLGVITKGGNFGLSAGMSLAFYVIYWALLIGGEKLADRGHLDPFISMWAGNFIIGLFGLYLTLKVSRESWKLFTFPKKKKHIS